MAVVERWGGVIGKKGYVIAYVGQSRETKEGLQVEQEVVEALL